MTAPMMAPTLPLSRSLLVALFSTLGLAATARAECPLPLRDLRSDSLPANVKSLCELHARYEKAYAQVARVSSPESAWRLGNALAPRLIELHTWRAALGDGFSDPWWVYRPAPLTWERYQAAATIVQNRAREAVRAGKIAPFSRDKLQALHRIALQGLFSSAGSFRRGNMDVLLQVNRRFSLTRDEVRQLREIEYRYRSGERLVTWTPVACIENLPPEALERLKKKISGGGQYSKTTYTPVGLEEYFAGDDGQLRQCGYYGYAKGGKVGGLVDDFLVDLNREIERINFGSSGVDPLVLASHAQRRYVTIHPHDDGNGRMSRFIMDEILLSLGLPAPILPDMARDIFVSEREWARRIGQGMLLTVEAFESCARDMRQRGCVVTSEMPTPDPKPPRTSKAK